MQDSATGAPHPTERRRPRTRILLLALCLAVAAFSIVAYLQLDPAQSRVDIRSGVPLHYPVLVAHILTSVIALVLGPLQFWPELRRRGHHRLIGRVYLFAGVFPGALTGLVAAVLSTYGPTAQVGFLLLSLLWLGTAIGGYRAVLRGHYAEHRDWMIRQFALTLAAVTLRLWLPLLLLVFLPTLHTTYDGDGAAYFREVYQVVPWLCWVPNLIVAEWYVQRRRATAAPRTDTRTIPDPRPEQ
ncbi:DUF2306 domain-containing protein [Lipingzhangella sp. LS1_29]|uniref:DUF2306 domain-containing protein n=1 Tax=Lipingzhangella rawalii TaxID=2055835 RepID=A0ABU2HBV9_9ACTN|nr:DUF2306 domain-containing protein [Lipingzhangella rawalii]MDS1272310.1 DUF2306 domain-containing protein [Lipingzhangella rawalii]